MKLRCGDVWASGRSRQVIGDDGGADPGEGLETRR